jgi:GT2 family glycosyltransferase
MPKQADFKVAIHLLELTHDQLQWPTGLDDYAGLRIFVMVEGQVIGHFTLWNSRRPLPLKHQVYDASYSLWLPVAHAIFGSGSPELLDRMPDPKGLILNTIGWSQAQLTALLVEHRQTTLTLPDLSASIILATKDRPQDLSRALHHLRDHKTQVPHEIIVADNNPASGLTAPVVSQFPGVVYVSERRPGSSYARNAGALAARGDIVVLTDDDVLVGENWLDQMIAPFAGPEVGAVMGLVLPYEFSTPSQYFFEESGGLGLGYKPARFGREFFSTETFPSVARLGNGSSAAFRATTYADPNIGPLEDALASGTYARGGGDVYQFYRVLAGGMVTVYNPKAYVFHKHRTTMAQLRQQLVNFNCGYAATLTCIITRDQDRRAIKVLCQNLPWYQLQRLLSSLTGSLPVPAHLILLRLWGNLIGPFNLWRALRQCRKLGTYSAAQFAERFAKREPLTAQAVVEKVTV